MVQGPAILYYAPFGTTEPADSSVTPDGYLVIPPAPWTDIGGVESGVSADIEHTITDQMVDQLIDPVGGRLTKRVIQVTATLSEATLQNLNVALNSNLTLQNLSGYATADPLTTTSATQPQYYALMVYGWAPILASGKPALRRVTIRKVLSQPKVTLDYQMTKYATYAVTWKAYYVAPSVPPFHVVDALV